MNYKTMYIIYIDQCNSIVTSSSGSLSGSCKRAILLSSSALSKRLDLQSTSKHDRDNAAQTRYAISACFMLTSALAASVVSLSPMAKYCPLFRLCLRANKRPTQRAEKKRQHRPQHFREPNIFVSFLKRLVRELLKPFFLKKF